jgi:hypothetical protein
MNEICGIPPVLRGEPTMGRFLTDVHILALRDAKVVKIISTREIFLSRSPNFSDQLSFSQDARPAIPRQ